MRSYKTFKFFSSHDLLCSIYNFHIGKFYKTESAKRSEKDSPLQAKTFLSFVKRFSEFAKRIYETRNPNFFNFKLIVVVFSKV